MKLFDIALKQICVHVKQKCVTEVNHHEPGAVRVCLRSFVDPPAPGKTILFNANDKNIPYSMIQYDKIAYHNILIHRLNKIISCISDKIMLIIGKIY